MRSRFSHLVLCLCLLLPATETMAEVSEYHSRPTIGLVLSGGGARGAAHAGVLEVLEDLRIPIDYVAGTSMGSVVGGLYSCGLSPQEIEANLRDIDWDDVFDDRPPRRQLPLRRKLVDQIALFDIELGLGPHGPELPSGLVAGQKLSYLLEALTLRCADASNFDQLAIPFRAVATDIDTGSRVVLWKGSIAEAMRASMAVPGAFTPVDHDGLRLVDGGLVCNLPIDLVRAMGADIVIAVDISPQVNASPEGSSAIAVLTNSLYLLMDQNAIEQRELLGPDDILVTPDLGDMNPADFHSVPGAIDAGADGARSVADKLSRLSVSETEYRAFLEHQRRADTRRSHEVVIDQIVIRGVWRADPRIVLGAIKTEVGARLHMDVLREDLDRIYELGDFQRVTFQLISSGAGHLLVIDLEEKSWGPHFLRVGLSAEADFQGESAFTGIASFLTTRINPYGGEWRTRIGFGAENSVMAELYQPIGFAGLFFVSPQFGFSQQELEVPAREQLVEEYHVSRQEGVLDLGVQLRDHGELRAGVFLGAVSLTGRGGNESERAAIGGYALSATMDQLDSLSFPRSGAYLNVRGRFLSKELGSDDSYEKGEASGCIAMSRGEHALVAVVRGGTSLGTNLPVYERFELGGLFSLSGLERDELRGQRFALGELIYHYRVLRLPRPFGTGVYAGVSFEAGNVWDGERTPHFDDLQYAGSVFVGADTFVGPLYLGLGLAEHEASSAYISLGLSLIRS